MNQIQIARWRRRAAQTAAGAVAVLGAIGGAQAAGLGFMSKGPMAHFSEADMKLLNQALDKALAAPETGTPVEWSNPATSAGGAMVVIIKVWFWIIILSIPVFLKVS